MELKLRLLAASLAIVASAAQADPVLWFSDSAGRLGKVDIASGNATLVGNMGEQMTDIAFSPSGQLFGTTFNSLYSINSTTGAVTFISNHFRTINALVFGQDGTLYGAGSSLYTFNPTTGANTFIGGLGASSSGDLAFVDGKMYLSTLTGGFDQLREVNVSTGASTLVGSIGRTGVYGLASPNGTDLYGMSGSSVFDIDPATGAAGPSLVNFSGFSQTFGTTFFEEARPPVDPLPIPEPSTYALMALGLAAVGFAARRRG